ATTKSIAAFEGALQAATNDARRCQAQIGLARGLRVADRSSEGLAVLDSAQSLAADRHSDLDLAWLHHLRGNFYFPLGRVEGCGAEHARALDHARRATSDELETRALGGLGDAAYAQGRMASAYRHFSECVDKCRAYGMGRIEVANLSMVGHCLVYLNRFEEALQSMREAMALARRVGHARAEVIACTTSRMLAFLLTADEAVAIADRILYLTRQIGAKRFMAEGLARHASFLMLQGRNRRSQALDLVHCALEASREAGLEFVGPDLLGQLAVLTDDDSL